MLDRSFSWNIQLYKSAILFKVFFFMKMKSLCLLIVLFGLGGLAFGNLIENGDFARGEGESVPGWSFRVFDPDKPLRGLCFETYRISDDPYLQCHW
jgi:hypothetical protein